MTEPLGLATAAALLVALATGLLTALTAAGVALAGACLAAADWVVGRLAALGFATVDPEVAAAVRRGVDLMVDLGAQVTEVDPGFDDPAEMFRTLWWAGARAALGHLPPEDHARMDAGLVQVLADAQKITLDQYLAAAKARGALGAQMRQFMEGFDVLVTPTMPIAAFAAGALSPYPVGPRAWLDWTPFSYPFNLTQQPASSLNCGFTASGLPIGLQIVGRMFDDRTVLRASAAVEAALALWDQRPPMAV